MIKPKTIAIIPARAGSKRVPNKNLKCLMGKPLIAWTIESALRSSLIQGVCVSSDSQRILDVARELGAQPIERPSELATDTACTDAVIFHAIDQLKLDDTDLVILLQPTSPLRALEDINGALALFDDSYVDGVVSVCECEHSPLWSNTLSPNGSMKGFISGDLLSTRSQDLPTYFRLNGAIFSYRVGAYKQNGGRFYNDKTYAYRMSSIRSVDIDVEDDFEYANYLATRRNLLVK